MDSWLILGSPFKDPILAAYQKWRINLISWVTEIFNIYRYFNGTWASKILCSNDIYFIWLHMFNG